MVRLPNPQLADQWRRRLMRFDNADSTVAQFCRPEQCSVASLYQWRRNLFKRKFFGKSSERHVDDDSQLRLFERGDEEQAKVDRICPCCWKVMPIIGTDVTERLDLKPAELFVWQIRRQKRAWMKPNGSGL